MVDRLRSGDWTTVRDIYAQGIATGLATFETETPSWREWDAAHLGRPRLAARAEGEVVGWAALSPVSSRPCYRGVAEVSVYVSERARRRSVGTALLRTLVEQAEQVGIWSMQASIIAENCPSLALHQRCGFRIVGVRERIARLQGEWKDVVLLERRSPRW